MRSGPEGNFCNWNIDLAGALAIRHVFCYRWKFTRQFCGVAGALAHPCEGWQRRSKISFVFAWSLWFTVCLVTLWRADTTLSQTPNTTSNGSHVLPHQLQLIKAIIAWARLVSNYLQWGGVLCFCTVHFLIHCCWLFSYEDVVAVPCVQLLVKSISEMAVFPDTIETVLIKLTVHCLWANALGCSCGQWKSHLFNTWSPDMTSWT